MFYIINDRYMKLLIFISLFGGLLLASCGSSSSQKNASTQEVNPADTIYLGDLQAHPVYMQGSTSYKVVGTTTGHNTKVHVASSQPSNMSVGDIWFKIPS
jgi:hypothetical protein